MAIFLRYGLILVYVDMRVKAGLALNEYCWWCAGDDPLWSPLDKGDVRDSRTANLRRPSS